eukprot:m51a1_g6966 hypothetical protein (525) ;mRNA; r:89682-93327
MDFSSVTLRKASGPRRPEGSGPVELICDGDNYQSLMSESYLERYFDSVSSLSFRSRFVPLSRPVATALAAAHAEALHGASSAASSTRPELEELARSIDSEMREMGSAEAFVRLSSRSPKDAPMRRPDATRRAMQEELAWVVADEAGLVYDGWHTYPDFPFMFVITVTHNVPNSLGLFASIWLGPRLPFLGRFLACFSIHLVVLLLVPILTIFLSSSVSLPIILISTSFAGFATAMLFGAATGLSMVADPSCIIAFWSGNGIAGLIVSVIRAATKASFPTNDAGYRNSALLYFGIAALFIVACLIASVLVVRIPAAVSAIELRARDASDDRKSEAEETRARKVRYLPLFRKIWLQVFTCWSVLFVTLCLFPGVTSKIAGQNESLGDWFGVILTAFFNVFDFVGRTMPYVVKLFNAKTLWIPVVARAVAFFPLFLLPVFDVWQSDAAAYIIMAAFALTNGYFACLAMEYGPKVVDEEEREAAAITLSFAQNFGILCASFFSLVLMYIINHYGPSGSSPVSSESRLW